MFSKNHIINVISLSIVLTICLLLLNSEGNISYSYSFIFLAVSLSFIFFINKFSLINLFKFNSKLKMFLIVSLLLITTFIVYFVPHNHHDLFLDSYNSWLSNFFIGSYPYQPKQVFFGFPLLYFFGLIFFITGQSILIVSAGIGLVLFFILQNSKFNNEFFVRIFFISLVIFLCLIFNSNLIPFFIIAIPLLLIYLIENENLTIHSTYSTMLLGIVAGLFLSVHLISSAIIIFYLYFFFRQDLKAMLKVFSISIFIFILTLLPFAIWNWESFLNFNPVIWQIEEFNISMLAMILTGTFALFAVWMISDIQEFYFTAGLLLFILAIYKFSDHTEIIHYGRSFLLYSAILLILSIKHYKVDRFLGKVLK